MGIPPYMHPLQARRQPMRTAPSEAAAARISSPSPRAAPGREGFSCSEDGADCHVILGGNIDTERHQCSPNRKQPCRIITPLFLAVQSAKPHSRLTPIREILHHNTNKKSPLSRQDSQQKRRRKLRGTTLLDAEAPTHAPPAQRFPITGDTVAPYWMYKHRSAALLREEEYSARSRRLAPTADSLQHVPLYDSHHRILLKSP